MGPSNRKKKAVLSTLEEVVSAFRSKGTLNRSELVKLGTSPSTVDRVRKALEDAGAVVRVDDKFWWCEYTTILEYEKRYDRALQHSKNVTSGLKPLLELSKIPSSAGQLKGLTEKGLEYATYAIQHLETGYPETLEMWKQAMAMRNEAFHMVKALKSSIDSSLSAAPFPDNCIDPDAIVDGIFDDIISGCCGASAKFLPGIELHDGDLWSGSEDIVMPEASKDLISFVEAQEGESSNLSSGEKISRLRGKEALVREKSNASINELILLVDNGRPMRGKCAVCPQVKVIARHDDRRP